MTGWMALAVALAGAARMFAALAGNWIEERRQTALRKLAEKGQAHDLLAKAIRARFRAADAAAGAGGVPDNTALDGYRRD